MKLDKAQLIKLGKIADTGALNAGKLITSYLNKNIEVQVKEFGSTLAGSVVTEVDLLSQEVILQSLKESIHEFDLGLLAEEDQDSQSRHIKDYFWCIDPLDGTLPFTEKRKGFSVSIGLVSKEGVPHVASIYDPVSEILYSSLRGVGSFKNGQPVKIKDSNSKCFHLHINRSLKDSPQYDGCLSSIRDLVQKLGYEKLEISAHAGSVLHTCWIYENAPAAYFALPKKSDGGGCLWDFAASSLFINECGGVASDIYGQPIDLNRKDSLFLNHKGILVTSDQTLHTYFRQLLENINTHNV